MGLRLTDEEIEAWLFDRLGGGNKFEQFNRLFCQDFAKAQLKKVVEWRNEECTEHSHTINISGVDRKMIVMHNDCEECWQALLEEVKE